MAVRVIHQLNFESLDFEVVLVGSLFNGGSLLMDPLRETVRAAALGARVLRLEVPPVVGGVLLGMEQVGRNGASIRVQLMDSIHGLIRSA